MTATDELRRLLDERGVEYDGKTYEGVTFWNDDTNMAVASEDYGGKLWVSQSLTPEQAVEATLVSDLEAENAKLRRLVLDYEELAAALCDARECDGCPFDSEQTICEHMRLIARVGELGVDA